MKKKPTLFVAATNQNMGKTTASLGIFSGLEKRLSNVGFIKPVGQQYVTVKKSLPIDKDVVLFHEQFGLQGSFSDMSPIVFTPGTTKELIDKKIHSEELYKKLKGAYDRIYSAHNATLVEGTGHCGVGALADLNNAQVAKHLKTPILLVTSGGIGSSYDALALNKALCERFGAKVIGILLNKIQKEKREMILDYVSRALKKWDIPLIGAIPFERSLTTFCMKDFESLFKAELLCGAEYRMRHFSKNRLVATSVETYRKLITKGQLVITPSTREDIILATIKAHWDMKINNPDEDLESGFVLTGSTPPTNHIIEQLKKAKIPALYSGRSSFVATEMITSFTAKIRPEDKQKTNEAIELMEHHIDFETLLDRMAP